MTTFWRYPKVSVLSSIKFHQPRHLPVSWGESSALGDPGEMLIEYAGRLCYMSQSNPGNKSTGEYLTNILKQAHGSVLEHYNISLLVEGISRSLTHEWVRHRAGFAYSQLSQRYVDESDTDFVCPPALLEQSVDNQNLWGRQMERAREEYTMLSDMLFREYHHIEDRVHRRKTAREAARSVLPNATETKIVVTANARAWRQFLELRGSEGADREIRRLAVEILSVFKTQITSEALFADFEMYTAHDGANALRCVYHKV